jgi:hypothetical protein
MYLLLFALSAMIPVSASAHKPSDSYLTITVSEDTVTGQWDIALRDLDYAIGLDSNDDGAITWGEMKGRHEAIAAYAMSRLEIASAEAWCALATTDHLINRHSDGAYAVLQFTADCSKTPRAVQVAYNLLFDVDPQHRGLLQLRGGDRVHTAIFSPDQRFQQFNMGEVETWRQLADYLWNGVWHIWIGYDHVLFLLTLLLPAVLYRRDGGWQPVADLRAALFAVVKIVTAFTLAHSITLSLAVLGVVELPTRLVESIIAASIVIAALNNVYPLVTRWLWLIAFGFGLVHGFGFANVLADLGLPGTTLLVALFGFNLGVELGQLAIVAAFLPVAYCLRCGVLYPRVALPLGSAAVAGIAAMWLVERTFDLDLPIV